MWRDHSPLRKAVEHVILGTKAADDHPVHPCMGAGLSSTSARVPSAAGPQSCPGGASGLIETFIYVLDGGEGSLTVTVGGRTEVMLRRRLCLRARRVGISFRNETDKPCASCLCAYKRSATSCIPDPAM